VVGGAQGGLVYANRATLEFSGRTLEETVARPDIWSEIVHPDDLNTVQATIRGSRKGSGARSSFACGDPMDSTGGSSAAVRRCGDAQGRVIGWFSTGTDIDDRKRAEQRMQDENLALREEVDRTSMFEEIVGASASLRAVLTSVSQVAPTDSTVLITGEPAPARSSSPARSTSVRRGQRARSSA